MQKKSLSFGEDPLLKDLNLLTRLLFLLVIFKKEFSMGKFGNSYQLNLNSIKILINYLLIFYFIRSKATFYY